MNAPAVFRGDIVPFSDMEKMAQAIAKSGLFGMKEPTQALALMLTAQAEGQHPATITQDYDIIQGKAARKTHSVLARFQQAGGKVEWHELTNAKADATFSHPSGGALRLTWTLDDAKRAGLDGKDNWRKFPRAMLRARCIAEGVRAVYPAAIGGALVVEEAQDIEITERPEVVINESRPERAIERTSYPGDQFDTNLPKWRQLIADGKKTADDIIATVESKGALTEHQKKKIRGEANIEDAQIVGEPQ